MLQSIPSGRFPTGSGLLFGLGLGGFFDGIVFHQLLQWHHMVSSWYPPDTLDNLRLNTLWDGIFHSTTYVASCSRSTCSGASRTPATCTGRHA